MNNTQNSTNQGPKVAYDYENQAWIENGRYVACAHPASLNCRCYGKLHAGEIAVEKAIER